MMGNMESVKMYIPVYVQPPCKPQNTYYVGLADDHLSAAEVAVEMGVPAGCFLEGKVIRRKGAKRWSLIADVKFRDKIKTKVAI